MTDGADSGGLRVCAVVWTYDRPTVLQSCLEALLAQTHPVGRIVVVDSASPSPLPADVIDRFQGQVEFARLPDNAGPGAAIAEGLGRVPTRDTDLVWFVEDDSIPGPACLEDLISAGSGVDVVGIDGAMVRRGEWRTVPRPRPGETVAVDFAYLDGVLAPMSVVTAVGVPRRDYFLMLVDVEYPLRFRRAGVRTLLVGTTFETRRLGSDPGTSRFRAYYQTRNHLHMVLHAHRSVSMCAGFVVRTLRQTLSALIGRRWWEMGLRSRGVADALRARMGRTLNPGRPSAPGDLANRRGDPAG